MIHMLWYSSIKSVIKYVVFKYIDSVNPVFNQDVQKRIDEFVFVWSSFLVS